MTNHHNLIDLTGRQFGRLQVIKPGTASPSGQPRWECICECGKTVYAYRGALLDGRSVSCGCYKKELLSKGIITSQNRTINSMKQSARIRKLVWELSKDQALLLMSQNCHYCGEPPTNITVYKNKPDSVPFHYNGLDRLDSLQGYTTENVVPCCKHCNLAKHTMSVVEFKTWICRTYIHMFGEQS